MNAFPLPTRSRLAALVFLLLLRAAPAFSDDGLTITLSNDTTSNIRVTVYDRNIRPARKVVSAQTINGFASITINITADASGLGHLSWTAVTLDSDMPQCGHRDKPGLNDGDTVHIRLNAECPVGGH